MRIYWRLRDIPELVGLSLREQREAWRACYGHAIGHWHYWRAAIAVMLSDAVCLGIVSLAVKRAASGLTSSLTASAISGIFVGTFGVIYGFAMNHVTVCIVRPHLLDYVAAHFPTEQAAPSDTPDSA
jgi:hypothetical protein